MILSTISTYVFKFSQTYQTLLQIYFLILSLLKITMEKNKIRALNPTISLAINIYFSTLFYQNIQNNCPFYHFHWCYEILTNLPNSLEILQFSLVYKLLQKVSEPFLVVLGIRVQHLRERRVEEEQRGKKRHKGKKNSGGGEDGAKRGYREAHKRRGLRVRYRAGGGAGLQHVEEYVNFNWCVNQILDSISIGFLFFFFFFICGDGYALCEAP